MKIQYLGFLPLLLLLIFFVKELIKDENFRISIIVIFSVWTGLMLVILGLGWAVGAIK